MGYTLTTLKAKAEIEEHQVQLGEIADGVYDRHTLSSPPSLAALKLQDLLMKVAGGAICEDRWHEMDLSAIKGIRGMRNATHRDVVELFRQLRSATLIYDNEAKGYTGIYGMIAVGRVEFEGKGKMRWRFDPEFRKVAEASNLYAVLDRQTSLALSSRYAHRLHEMVAFRAGREKNIERFSVDDLRDRLGVQTGRLKTWSHFQKRALQPAVDEINQMSRFHVAWRVSRKYRRRVEEVELVWEIKRELEPVKRELDQPKVGRQARRAGTVERLGLSFPVSGTIRSSSPWDGLAREHVARIQGGQLPDLDSLANAFRYWCKTKGIPLDAKGIEKTFTGFCKNYKPN